MKDKQPFTDKAEMLILHITAIAIKNWLTTSDGKALCPNAVVNFDGETIEVCNDTMGCVVTVKEWVNGDE